MSIKLLCECVRVRHLGACVLVHGRSFCTEHYGNCPRSAKFFGLGCSHTESSSSLSVSASVSISVYVMADMKFIVALCWIFFFNG